MLFLFFISIRYNLLLRRRLYDVYPALANKTHALNNNNNNNKYYYYDYMHDVGIILFNTHVVDRPTERSTNPSSDRHYYISLRHDFNTLHSGLAQYTGGGSVGDVKVDFHELAALR